MQKNTVCEYFGSVINEKEKKEKHSTLRRERHILKDLCKTFPNYVY